MSQSVDLPDGVFAALNAAARASGTTVADWIAAHLPEPTAADNSNSPPIEDWIDHDFLSAYRQPADDSVSLDAVRTAMSKIPGRLADDIRAERDER